MMKRATGLALPISKVIVMKKVTYQLEDGIATVTIDNPPMNALSNETTADLLATFDELSDIIDEVNAVILTGEGKKAFVAGGDIKEFSELNPEKARTKLEKSYQRNRKIERFPKPVICAIDGYCLGGGLELAMCCDIRVATERSKFGQLEINLGLIPGAGGTQRLPRLVNAGIAKELIYTGKMISAEEAEKIGLINCVVPEVNLMETVKEMVGLIASKAPLALRAAKEAIDRGMSMSLEDGIALERDLWSYLCGTEDQKEGAAAFNEKRKPVFKGK